MVFLCSFSSKAFYDTHNSIPISIYFAILCYFYEFWHCSQFVICSVLTFPMSFLIVFRIPFSFILPLPIFLRSPGNCFVCSKEFCQLVLMNVFLQPPLCHLQEYDISTMKSLCPTVFSYCFQNSLIQNSVLFCSATTLFSPFHW